MAIGHTPFRNLGRAAESLDSLLTEQRAGRDESVRLLIHLASPWIQYTDRGKSSISLDDDEEDDEDEEG